jgi:hypothetical protein
MIPSFDGKGQRYGDWFDQLPSTPILAFPRQGERCPSKHAAICRRAYFVGHRVMR